MAKRKTAPKRKTTSTKKTKGKSSRKNTKKGFNLARFSLILILLVVIGYAGLAIWEGQLFPKSLENIEIPTFGDDDEGDDDEGIEEREEVEKETPAAKEVEAPKNNLGYKSNLEGFDLYFTKAFDFAWPAYSADEAIIERPYYTLRYNEKHEQAMWVAYPLWADSLAQETYKRKDDFREDRRVKSGSASLNDYKGSGYDRGHLAPAADFSYDEFALSQSFFMSNMSPQAPSFNRGIWKKLEDQVRDWAAENDKLYVVIGPVLNKNFKTIGTNRVSVPEYYYKIILDLEKPQIKAIAFLMKNEKSSASLESFTVTIDRIESLTGLDFFPTMPDEMEADLEGVNASALWF